MIQCYILWAVYIEMNKLTLFLDLCNIRFFICFENDLAAFINFKCFLWKEGWWNIIVNIALHQGIKSMEGSRFSVYRWILPHKMAQNEISFLILVTYRHFHQTMLNVTKICMFGITWWWRSFKNVVWFIAVVVNHRSVFTPIHFTLSHTFTWFQYWLFLIFAWTNIIPI